jgi:hypothetical protein
MPVDDGSRMWRQIRTAYSSLGQDRAYLNASFGLPGFLAKDQPLVRRAQAEYNTANRIEPMAEKG